jgi:hypothetical protein
MKRETLKRVGLMDGCVVAGRRSKLLKREFSLNGDTRNACPTFIAITLSEPLAGRKWSPKQQFQTENRDQSDFKLDFI